MPMRANNDAGLGIGEWKNFEGIPGDGGFRETGGAAILSLWRSVF